MMLDVTVERERDIIYHDLSLNDVAITNLDITMICDDFKVENVNSDPQHPDTMVCSSLPGRSTPPLMWCMAARTAFLPLGPNVILTVLLFVLWIMKKVMK